MNNNPTSSPTEALANALSLLKQWDNWLCDLTPTPTRHQRTIGRNLLIATRKAVAEGDIAKTGSVTLHDGSVWDGDKCLTEGGLTLGELNV